MKKRYWQEKNPVLYEQTRAEIRAKYPTLHFRLRERIVFLEGIFQLADNCGVIDYFHVEIEIPSNFPEEFPIVREVGGRIPRIADRHMLDDGRTCLHVQEDWYYSHPNGYTLCEFLDGPVLAFFVGQTLVELGKPWPFGERPHGIDGVLECYKELTGAADLATAQIFLAALAHQEIKGHHLCPCGSGQKIRHCHTRLLEVKMRIPRNVIRCRWNVIADLAKQDASKR